MSTDALRDANTLIHERVQRDLHDGIAFLKQRLQSRTRSTLGALATAAEMAALGLLVHVKEKRIREDVRHLLDLSRRVATGEEPQRVAEQHLDRVLRKDELKYVLRTQDPAFLEIEKWLRANMTARLPDLARLATAGPAPSYEALAREAFPDRAEAERILAEQHALTRKIIAHVQEHPHVARLPRAWVLSYLSVGHEIMDWAEQRARDDMDAIYAAE